MIKIADDCIRLVPDTTHNVTFNRLSPDCSTQWNSWSAGGRDDNDIIKMLSRYNGHGSGAGRYGKETYNCYYIFNNIIRGVRWQD